MAHIILQENVLFRKIYPKHAVGKHKVSSRAAAGETVVAARNFCGLSPYSVALPLGVLDELVGLDHPLWCGRLVLTTKEL